MLSQHLCDVADAAPDLTHPNAHTHARSCVCVCVLLSSETSQQDQNKTEKPTCVVALHYRESEKNM